MTQWYCQELDKILSYNSSRPLYTFLKIFWTLNCEEVSQVVHITLMHPVAKYWITNMPLPLDSWQDLGKVRDQLIGPFSRDWVPEMTPDSFLVVMKYIVSLFLRPPYGRNGRFPVATWNSVTPMDHKSTVAPNVFLTALRSTALAYISGCRYSSVPWNRNKG